MRITIEQTLGLDDSHLLCIPGCGLAIRKLQAAALDAFVLLRERCSHLGIELAVASSYRSYQQQLTIWNEKFYGQRPVYDAQGNRLDINSLDDKDKVFAILRWSALPGASRHHWGSDLDVYDKAAITDGYVLQLVPEEYTIDGPFSALGQFLNEQFRRGDYCDFFQPYAYDHGGIAVEPWHISHRPTAEICERMLNPDALRAFVAQSEIAGKQVVLENLEEIWQRFIHIEC